MKQGLGIIFHLSHTISSEQQIFFHSFWKISNVDESVQVVGGTFLKLSQLYQNPDNSYSGLDAEKIALLPIHSCFLGILVLLWTLDNSFFHSCHKACICAKLLQQMQGKNKVTHTAFIQNLVIQFVVFWRSQCEKVIT